MKKGKFITFEGPEGAGKTTQITLLKEHLESKGVNVILTREPGGTEVSTKIRQVLLDPNNRAMTHRTELLLYAADRSQHVDQKIRPALEAGNWILCDRYVDSTVAYQGYGRSLDMELIVDLCQIATNDLMPELTILVDLPPEVGMERVVKRGSADSGAEKDRIEEEKMDFHHRVREGFLAISRQEPHRMKVVDGTKDIATIQANIQKIVAEADLFDN